MMSPDSPVVTLSIPFQRSLRSGSCCGASRSKLRSTSPQTWSHSEETIDFLKTLDAVVSLNDAVAFLVVERLLDLRWRPFVTEGWR